MRVVMGSFMLFQVVSQFWRKNYFPSILKLRLPILQFDVVLLEQTVLLETNNFTFLTTTSHAM